MPDRFERRGVLGARAAAAVLMACALVGSASTTGAATVADPGGCLGKREARFLELINDYRDDHGVPALAASRALNEASYLHSEDMAENDYFDHVSQDGRTPEDRMADRGYDTDTYTGENIAAGYPSAQEVFETWRESPGHNENMLSEHYRAIGIGRAVEESSTYGEYWTTDFGGEVDAAPECVAR